MTEVTNADPSEVINFDDIDENQQYEVLPQNTYDVVVDQVEYAISQSKGNPMYSWQLLVEGGEHDGSRLYFHTVLTGKSASRFKKAMINFGHPLTGEMTLGELETLGNSGQLVGLRGRAVVKIRNYEGSPRNNVSDILTRDEAFVG